MSNLGEASALAHLLADAGIQFKVTNSCFAGIKIYTQTPSF